VAGDTVSGGRANGGLGLLEYSTFEDTSLGTAGALWLLVEAL